MTPEGHQDLPRRSESATRFLEIRRLCEETCPLQTFFHAMLEPIDSCVPARVTTRHSRRAYDPKAASDSLV